MSVAGGCRRLRVTEQLTDNRQAKSRAGSDAGVLMPQIMEAHADKSGALGDKTPSAIKVCAGRFPGGALVLASDDVGANSRQIG
jgi:hypothetical protein